MECKYCNHVFSNNINLKTHQSTARYCLKLQNKNINPTNNCDGCNKIFTTKQMLEKHIINCIKKNNIQLKEITIENQKLKQELDDKKNIIIELEKENIILKEKEKLFNNLKHDYQEIYKLLATKNTNINTTTNNTQKNIYVSMNPLDFSQEYFKQKIEEYKNEYKDFHFLSGQDGLADFVVKYLLTDNNNTLMYVSTDTSRQKFKFKNLNGDITEDNKADKLIEYLFPLNRLISEMYDKIKDDQKYENFDLFRLGIESSDVFEMKHELSHKFRNRLAILTKK